jgi:hypothetical protein
VAVRCTFAAAGFAVLKQASAPAVLISTALALAISLKLETPGSIPTTRTVTTSFFGIQTINGSRAATSPHHAREALGTAARRSVGEFAQAEHLQIAHGLFADGSCLSGVIARLQMAGLNVTSVQNPLSTLPEAVASAERVLAWQGGPCDSLE